MREKAGRVDIPSLLRELSRREILSLLVEGGGEIHGSFLEAGVVDEVFFFLGPVIIGGKEAPCAVAGRGAETLSQALWLSDLRVRRLGDSLLLHGLSPEGRRLLESTL